MVTWKSLRLLQQQSDVGWIVGYVTQLYQLQVLMQFRQTGVNVHKSDAEGISTTAIHTEAVVSDAPVCVCIILRFIDYQ